MDKFKRGDRVRYTGKHQGYEKSHFIGKLGTVESQDNALSVVVWWDNHSDATGHYPDNLALLTGSDLLLVAIDEYQAACAEFEAAQLAVEKAKSRIEDARLALKEALS